MSKELEAFERIKQYMLFYPNSIYKETTDSSELMIKDLEVVENMLKEKALKKKEKQALAVIKENKSVVKETLNTTEIIITVPYNKTDALKGVLL